MTRILSSITVFSMVILLAGQSYALDGYRDRKGLFYGATLGGASFKADVAGSKRNLGYVFGGRIGGGVSDTLTLDGSLNLSFQSYTQGGINIDTNSTEMLIGANFFIEKGLYARAEGGLITQGIETDVSSQDETGVVVGGGLGFEFFASADLAVGFGATYQMQQFDTNNVSSLKFAITATWY